VNHPNAELDRIIADLEIGNAVVTPENAKVLLRHVYQLGFFDGRVDGIKYATTSSVSEENGI
jgi:hypothetical protein